MEHNFQNLAMKLKAKILTLHKTNVSINVHCSKHMATFVRSHAVNITCKFSTN